MQDVWVTGYIKPAVIRASSAALACSALMGAFTLVKTNLPCPCSATERNTASNLDDGTRQRYLAKSSRNETIRSLSMFRHSQCKYTKSDEIGIIKLPEIDFFGHQTEVSLELFFTSQHAPMQSSTSVPST